MSIDAWRLRSIAVCSAVSGCGGVFAVQDCDALATKKIEEAHALVSIHADTLFPKLAFLSGRERRMRNRWPITKVRCIDRTPRCLENEGLYGVADGWGDDIRVCWNNMKRRRLCDLVDNLVHEKAHTDKVPVLPGHNHDEESVWIVRADPVYRAGRIAREACQTSWGRADEDLDEP